MKDKTTHLYVDSHERTLILHSLVELKNALIVTACKVRRDI